MYASGPERHTTSRRWRDGRWIFHRGSHVHGTSTCVRLYPPADPVSSGDKMGCIWGSTCPTGLSAGAAPSPATSSPYLESLRWSAEASLGRLSLGCAPPPPAGTHAGSQPGPWAVSASETHGPAPLISDCPARKTGLFLGASAGGPKVQPAAMSAWLGSHEGMS